MAVKPVDYNGKFECEEGVGLWPVFNDCDGNSIHLGSLVECPARSSDPISGPVIASWVEWIDVSKDEIRQGVPKVLVAGGGMAVSCEAASCLVLRGK